MQIRVKPIICSCQVMGTDMFILQNIKKGLADGCHNVLKCSRSESAG